MNSKFHIGDKVRPLLEKGEGIVRKVSPNGEIYVEMNDGFPRTFLATNLVLIAQDERFIASEREIQKSKISSAKNPLQADAAPKATFGRSLAIVPVMQNKFQLYLINNTDCDTPFTVSVQRGNSHTGLHANVVRARNHFRIDETEVANKQNFPAYHFRMLYFEPKVYGYMPPIDFLWKLDKHITQCKLQKVPIINTEGYVFQLDKDWMPLLDAKLLLRNFVPAAAENLPEVALSNIPEVIDLHQEELEKLIGRRLYGQDVLAAQKEYAAKAIDTAIVNRREKLILIHGVGTFVLKAEIEKLLQELQSRSLIKGFKPAKKEKFGEGATQIEF